MNKLRALCDRVGAEPHLWSVLGVLDELRAILDQGEPDEAAVERATEAILLVESDELPPKIYLYASDWALAKRQAVAALRAAREG